MGKHSSGKDNKKIKTIIFIIILILSIITVILLFNVNNEPKTAIDNAFSALKAANKEDANKNIDYNQLIYCLDEILTNDDNTEIGKELFSDMSWKVEHVEINSNEATAIVEVTNKNFIKVITNWMKKMTGEKSQGKEITDVLSKLCLKETLKETKETKTVIKKIALEKEDKNWRIVVDDELKNLLYPGIDSVVEGLNNKNSSN